MKAQEGFQRAGRKVSLGRMIAGIILGIVVVLVLAIGSVYAGLFVVFWGFARSLPTCHYKPTDLTAIPEYQMTYPGAANRYQDAPFCQRGLHAAYLMSFGGFTSSDPPEITLAYFERELAARGWQTDLPFTSRGYRAWYKGDAHLQISYGDVFLGSPPATPGGNSYGFIFHLGGP